MPSKIGRIIGRFIVLVIVVAVYEKLFSAPSWAAVGFGILLLNISDLRVQHGK